MKISSKNCLSLISSKHTKDLQRQTRTSKTSREKPLALKPSQSSRRRINLITTIQSRIRKNESRSNDLSGLFYPIDRRRLSSSIQSDRKDLNSIDFEDQVNPNKPSSPSSPSSSKFENDNFHDKPSKLDKLLKLGPVLFDPIRVPRSPIVLCHGLYGFSVRGPSSFPRFQIHYWGKLLEILRKRLGVKVIIGRVPSTGTIEQRARCLNEMLLNESGSKRSSFTRGGFGDGGFNSNKVSEFNILGHSMGGLDARYLISRLRPETYRVNSLTSICTPHRGSPFMDWCRANIGVGSQPSSSPSDQGKILKSENARRIVPFSLKEPLLVPRHNNESFIYLPNNLIKTFLLSLLDSPAYSNLSTDFLQNKFNPETPDDPKVMYFSIASRMNDESLSVLHPLWLTSLVLDRLGAKDEGGHDGLVTVESAKWGEFLGVVNGTDHWEIRGSSAFGTTTTTESDRIFNQQVKNTWLELNKYIGSWSSSSSSLSSSNNQSLKRATSSSSPSLGDLSEDQKNYYYDQITSTSSSSIYALAGWISKRLPRTATNDEDDVDEDRDDHSRETRLGSNDGKNKMKVKAKSRDRGEAERVRGLNYVRKIEVGFPLDDLRFDEDHDVRVYDGYETHEDGGCEESEGRKEFSRLMGGKKFEEKFDLETFYTAVLRNLYDRGL